MPQDVIARIGIGFNQPRGIKQIGFIDKSQHIGVFPGCQVTVLQDVGLKPG